MKKVWLRQKIRSLSYSKKLLISMFAATLVVAAIIGGMLLSSSQRMIVDMESAMAQKNMQIVGENLNSLLERVDALSSEIVASGYIRQENMRDSEFVTAYLNERLRNSKTEHDLTAYFLNVYFEEGNVYETNYGLPFSSYEECISWMEGHGIDISGRFTPTSWVANEEIFVSSGKKVTCCVWARFIYDPISMKRIGLITGGIDSAALQELFSVFDTAVLFQGGGEVLASTAAAKAEISFPELKEAAQNSTTGIGTSLLDFNGEETRVSYWKTPSIPCI